MVRISPLRRSRVRAENRGAPAPVASGKGEGSPALGSGHSRTGHSRTGLATWVVAALGVVYGDIGTSPLYALRECFAGPHGVALTAANILGVLSLVFWSLMLIVSVKYLGLILQADYKGEGGITALLARLTPEEGGRVGRRRGVLLAVGLFGAALLYGDGVITPAISVLSAVEGLEIATPVFRPFVVPLTVLILLALFAVQRRGTARVGAIFGPATLIWFTSLALLGVMWMVRRPEVLLALDPRQAVEFFERNGRQGFLVLSAVVLCVTGAEALYADLGHFGKKPIRVGWFAVVLPGLLLNYFGQGALLLEQGPPALKHPFYAMVPGLLLMPMIVLATLATVIASQALISGAYSLTQQAIHLGYLPRTQIAHTSHEAVGQIYIPQVNRGLMVGCIGLVLMFQHSSKLAAAYGVAVTGTMLITTVLFFAVARRLWTPLLAFAFLIVFLAIDGAFFVSNLSKLHEGGIIPVAIAASFFLLMSSWKKGKERLGALAVSRGQPIQEFLSRLQIKRPPRVRGTAVFMVATPRIAPPVLLQHFRHNQVLHERVILLSILNHPVPTVEATKRVEIEELSFGFHQVIANYGYMENPDISEILIYCLNDGLCLEINELSFYVGRESLLTVKDPSMPFWRKKLFSVLARNARPATDYFGLPPDQVIEIGTQAVL